MLFGVDYYPEHWPETRWEEDCRLMSAAGLSLVRILEFAWSRLEPEEGRYDFSWVERFLNLLEQHGLQFVLGTPSATPPKWLVDKDPSILPIDESGRTRGFGSRRHYCFSNSNYREHAARIAEELAKRFGNHHLLVAWQTDNEFGCHNTALSFTPEAHAGFIDWLKRKYQDIEALNEAWGSVFWSQEYRSFDEVILPSHTVARDPGASAPDSMVAQGHNPGLLLDFQRYSTDAIIAFHQAQVDAIRRHSDPPVTHNLMGDFPDIDYHRLGSHLDFVSWDNYPSFEWGRAPYNVVGFRHTLMRGLKRRPFWVMEQQSGPCGWRMLGDTPAPGEIGLWSLQAAAHGARTIVYFRWRACRTGTEQYWYGILDHDGIPRRRYREIADTVETAGTYEQLWEQTQFPEDVAVVHDYEHLWSHRFQPHNPGFSYTELLQRYYTALATWGVSPAVTSLEGALESARLVVLPAYSLVDSDTAARIERFVTAGGTVIVTYRSGIRDRNNAMLEEPIPGPFRRVAGLTVGEFDSLNFGRTTTVEGAFGQDRAAVWTDSLDLESAEAAAWYGSGPFAGEPAIAVNQFGDGTCVYVGCDISPEALSTLARGWIESAGVQLSPFVPQSGIEIVRRTDGRLSYYVLMNHTGRARLVESTRPVQSYTTQQEVRRIRLDPYGTTVVRES